MAENWLTNYVNGLLLKTYKIILNIVLLKTIYISNIPSGFLELNFIVCLFNIYDGICYRQLQLRRG